MIERGPFFPHRKLFELGWHAYWDGTRRLDQLSSVIFEDVIDNGPLVKFVTNLILPGIDPRFFERMFAYVIVNVFGV